MVQTVHLSCFSIRIFILHVLCSCLTSAYRCPRIDMTPVMVRWAQRRPGPGKWLLRKSMTSDCVQIIAGTCLCSTRV